MPQWDVTSREVNGATIPGTFLQAFIHNNHYYVTEIKIYKDGMIDCWGLVDLAGFKQKIEEGWVVTHVPEGGRVAVASGIWFTATEVNSGVGESEFVKQVVDEIKRLNGEPTSSDVCRDALRAYREDRSEKTKQELRRAYLGVPRHMRQYLGSMDDKDSEIRSIINLWSK